MSMLRGFLRKERSFLVGLALCAVLLTAGASWAIALARPASGTEIALAEGIGPGDADGDGLSDLDELARWGTDLGRNDTDDDTLPDGWEVAHARTAPGATRPCPDPLRPDADIDCTGKGLTAAEDLARGTDPRTRDTDGDGIEDAREVALHMDPLVDDADADPYGNGLTHRVRASVGARADRYDTACSGLSDAEKIDLGLDPARASTSGSGVQDGYAIHFALDAFDALLAVAHLDGDPDGLTVLEKAEHSARRLDLCARPDAVTPYARALDPRKNDSDGDTLPDAWEVRYGLDALDAGDAGDLGPAAAAKAGRPPDREGPPLPAHDLDGDGLSNVDEFVLGSCPDRVDCDGDQLSDLDEILTGWIVEVDGAARRVHSHPMRAVTDGDTLPDGAKRDGTWMQGGVTLRFPPLDPATPDTDADGISDALEITRYSGILAPNVKDTDGDGLVDGDEVAFWDARADGACATCDTDDDGQPNVADADADGDGIGDGDEVHPRSHPTAPGAATRAAFPATDPGSNDTDRDGLPDAWEKRHARLDADGLWQPDPARTSSSDAGTDLDDDGMTNMEELLAGTDPHNADTDGDGLPDGWERRYGGTRAPAQPAAGKGFVWLLDPGERIPLSPLDSEDAREPVATYRYTRFSADTAGRAAHERAAGGLRIEGTLSWTYLDLFAAGATPARPASGQDGVPDLWKALWSAPPLGDAPLDAPDGDADGLTLADEFAAGTDPHLPDSDLGGLSDAYELASGLDPLEPGDDAGDADLDGDGLTNGDELHVYMTDVAQPDTDRDGLLDGPDVVLSASSPEARAWIAQGIAHRPEGAALRFLGEHRVSADPAAGCARTWSCLADELPDAWKVYYGLPAGSFQPPATSFSADGLGVLLEYRWGRPTTWNEETDGPWWLGFDPTRMDTRRDGISDASHARVDGAADLDHDGLNDLSGEDPTPFYGAVDLTDPGATFRAMTLRGTASGPAAPLPPTSIDLATTLPVALAKGASITLHGTVENAPPGTPVLARLIPSDDTRDAAALRTSDARGVHGVGFVDANGTFTLDLSPTRTHEVVAPDNVTSVFARAPGVRLAWEADTSALSPGVRHRVVLWSHAQPGKVGAGVQAMPGDLLVTSAALVDAPSSLAAGPGETITFNATLRDGAGDARVIEDPRSLRISWLGETLPPERVAGPNATFALRVPTDAAPRAIEAEIVFAGDRVLSSERATLEVRPTLGTSLMLRASAGRVAIGGTLPVEGTLRDARGDPVPGMNVTIRFGASETWARTSIAGEFDATLHAAAATLGARQPTAAFNGGPFHAASTTNAAAVTLFAVPAFSDLVAEADLGRGGEVRGKLLVDGAAILDPSTGAPPRVRASSGSWTASVTPAPDGAFRIALPAALAQRPGLVTITLATEGTSLLDPARETIDAVVAGKTRITLMDARAARGGDARIRGALDDATGTPLADRPITLGFGAIEVAARTRGDGSFDARIAIPPSVDLGAHALRATFAGAPPVHASSEARATLAVVSATLLEIPRRVVRTDAPTLSARLVDDAATPLRGVLVDVSGRDGSVRAALTGDDGGFTLPLPPALLLDDVVVLRFRAEGAADRMPLDVETSVHVERATRLDITVPAELRPGENATISLRLATSEGAPVAQGDVRLRLGGIDLGNVRTTGAGRADLVFLVPADAPLGPTHAEADFSGRGAYLPAQASAGTLVRALPRLAMEASPTEGGRVLLSIQASGPSGALSRETILISVGGTTLRATTDDDGHAALVLPAAERIEASLPASSTLAANSATVLLSPASAIPLPRAYDASPVLPFAIALILLALFAILLVAYRRTARRTKSEVMSALRDADEIMIAHDENTASILLAYRVVIQALEKRGLLLASASPREVEAVLARDLGLPPEPVRRLIGAFEHARYADASTTSESAAEARAALGELRAHLKGVPA